MVISHIMITFAAAVSSFTEGMYPSQYMTYTNRCDTDSDCNGRDGEVCWRLYNGCHRGVCMCNPATHVRTADGSCRPYRLGDEPCSSNSLCLESMTCRNGTCKCVHGDVTRGGDFCVLPHQKLLGQRCEPSAHACLQITSDSRYTDENTECSNEYTCRCAEGYKQSGESCVELSIGDVGCTKQFHCEGGAICLDRKCVCPSGYHPVAKKSRCAKNSAVVDLPLEAACDEINEAMYCADGLICHQCDLHSPYKCVKYLNFHPNSYMSSADRLHFMLACFLPLFITLCQWWRIRYFFEVIVTR